MGIDKKKTMWIASIVLGIVFVINVVILIGQMQVTYDKLIERTPVEPIYEISSTISVQLNGNLNFTDISDAVREDFNYLRMPS